MQKTIPTFMDLLYVLIPFAGVVGVVVLMVCVELDVPLPRPLRRLAERGLLAVVLVAAIVTAVLLLTLAGIDAAIVDD